MKLSDKVAKASPGALAACVSVSVLDERFARLYRFIPGHNETAKQVGLAAGDPVPCLAELSAARFRVAAFDADRRELALLLETKNWPVAGSLGRRACRLLLCLCCPQKRVGLDCRAAASMTGGITSTPSHAHTTTRVRSIAHRDGVRGDSG